MGPLPIGDDATITPMRANGEIPWIKRPQSDQGERTAWVSLPDFLQGAHTDTSVLRFYALVDCWLCSKAFLSGQVGFGIGARQLMPPS